MEELEIIARSLLAGFMVWRLTRMFLQHRGDRSGGFGSIGPGRIEESFGCRLVDLFYCLSVWMSARTAIWTAYGFSIVFLVWIVFAGVSRLLKRSPEQSKLAFARLNVDAQFHDDRGQAALSYIAIEEGMQTNRG